MAFDLDQTIEILERTPHALHALLAGLSDEWLLADEGPDTFSAMDVVGHLIHGEEDDWIARAKIILEHGEGRPFDPFDRFAFRERYAGLPIADRLARFRELRARNVEELRALELGPAELEKTGTHPALGRVTLSELLATWTVHDFTHLAQIARVAAKRYAGAVGAWAEYLPILVR